MINNSGEEISVSVKRPKKVLHFSDGIMEEFTDEETDSTDSPMQKSNNLQVDEVFLCFDFKFS